MISPTLWKAIKESSVGTIIHLLTEGGNDRSVTLLLFKIIDVLSITIGEFVRANNSQCLSPANQVAFFSVRANKFAKWKTGLTPIKVRASALASSV